MGRQEDNSGGVMLERMDDIRENLEDPVKVSQWRTRDDGTVGRVGPGGCQSFPEDPPPAHHPKKRTDAFFEDALARNPHQATIRAGYHICELEDGFPLKYLLLTKPTGKRLGKIVCLNRGPVDRHATLQSIPNPAHVSTFLDAPNRGVGKAADILTKCNSV